MRTKHGTLGPVQRLSALVLIAFLARPGQAYSQYRSWTGQNGAVVDAELVSVSDDGATVTLRTREGQVKEGSISRLSADDQTYIRTSAAARAKTSTQAGTDQASAASRPANDEEQDPESRNLLERGLASAQRGDAVGAAGYFRKAADRGSAWGQNNLGCAYMNGDGVQKDAGEAVRWFRKAADQGLREAQGALGSCYTQGWGVEKNVVEGARWYRKAAEQGDAVAQRQLSLMYAVGMGVPKSNAEAVRWAREAASRGDEQAREWIAKSDARQAPGTPEPPATSMGHRNPWGAAGERVVGTYATVEAAGAAKRGMRGQVAGNIAYLEEQVINAGNASMTVQRPPEYRVEYDAEGGRWLSIERKY